MFTLNNPNNSFEAPECPNDGISSLSWFPSSSNNQALLAGASWDSSVRVWEVRFDPQSSGVQFQAKAIFHHEFPILTCCFSRVSINVLLLYRKSS